MKVKDIMTKDVITVTHKTSLKELVSILKEKRIHGVPVVGEDGVLVGVITLTDMLKILQRIVYWEDIEQLKPGIGIKDALVRQKEDTSVGKNMTTSVNTVTEDEPVEKVLELMCRHNIHTIPVVKENKLVGIIGATDIVELFI
ncbi:MAG: CBS domain-containing protein [Candidatus Omnitrophica bacterium]|nr:CBS domain-containing protein [Candidatus Omnitrophota bacterium]